MILERIVVTTRRDLARRQEHQPLEALREQVEELPEPLDFLGGLRQDGVSIVAEVKRASPSRGVLNDSLEPNRLAVSYARAGADAISVLTEPAHFRGSLADLSRVRDGLVGAGLVCPLLRKDFTVDSYQLYEARLWGADAVLLIAAILETDVLAALLTESLALGLCPLVEVHDSDELGRVLPLQPPLVGINNRNLYDFTVDLATTRELRPLVPPSIVVVSESGISQAAQVRELAVMRVDAALIGEALVTAEDPGAKLAALKEAGR